MLSLINKYFGQDCNVHFLQHYFDVSYIPFVFKTSPAPIINCSIFDYKFLLVLGFYYLVVNCTHKSLVSGNKFPFINHSPDAILSTRGKFNVFASLSCSVFWTQVFCLSCSVAIWFCSHDSI